MYNCNFFDPEFWTYNIIVSFACSIFLDVKLSTYGTRKHNKCKIETRKLDFRDIFIFLSLPLKKKK